MKLNFYFVGLFLFTLFWAFGQTIGTNNPNDNAALHVESPEKAVLLPKISLQASKTFTLDPTASSSDESLLLYNTNTDNSTSTGLKYFQLVKLGFNQINSSLIRFGVL